MQRHLPGQAQPVVGGGLLGRRHHRGDGGAPALRHPARQAGAQHVAPAACILIGTGIVCVLRKVLGARRTVRAIPIAMLPFLVVVIAGIARDLVRPYHSAADVMVRDIITELRVTSAPGDRCATTTR